MMADFLAHNISVHMNNNEKIVWNNDVIHWFMCEKYLNVRSAPFTTI